MEILNWQTILGEIIGTMILIILGNGVCFSVSHKKMFANYQQSKWILIVIGWGLAVFVSVLIAQAIGAPGHLNPAVSLYTSINTKNAIYLIFIIFQLIGAIIGQIILDLINWQFIISTSKDDSFATKSAHCTIPALNKKNNFLTNFSYEFLGTAILLSVILATSIIKQNNLSSKEISNTTQVTIAIIAIGISIGSATGYAINPARDLGPRIVYSIIKPQIEKKTKNKLTNTEWNYSWIPIIAPLSASCVIGAFSLI